LYYLRDLSGKAARIKEEGLDAARVSAARFALLRSLAVVVAARGPERLRGAA